ncbi:YveK family protein [Clostridium sp.]|uniref:YveK family protein n=2 Tax=Clostridium TaxID=1485 RepID=UPI00351FAFAB
MIDKLFDLDELICIFKRRFWIIIVVTLALNSLATYKVSKYKPSYTASMQIFVGDKDNMFKVYSEEQMQDFSDFFSLFSEVSKLDGFFDDALKKKKINKTSSEVAYSISFSPSSTIPLVTINYYSGTDKQMKETLEVVSKEVMDKVAQIIPGSKPTVIKEIQVSTIYPDTKKLPTIACIAGIFLSIGIILALDLLDNKIRSKKILEKSIPVPVLGCIPIAEKLKKESNDVHNEKKA